MSTSSRRSYGTSSTVPTLSVDIFGQITVTGSVPIAADATARAALTIGNSALNVANIAAAQTAAVTGGTAASSQTLIQWTAADAFQLTAATVDSDGCITTGTLLWPDGSSGVYTRTAKDATFLVTNAFTATHVLTGKTVTQATITRDAATGVPTVKPALTVA